MFTIIYEKETGKMLNVIAGKNDKEEMLKALPIEYDFCYAEKIPEHNMYRQYVKVEDEKLVVCNFELSPEREKEITIMETLRKIEEFKTLLYESDYKAIKYAEGIMSEEEYAPIREERKMWRLRINELEELIRSIEQIKP